MQYENRRTTRGVGAAPQDGKRRARGPGWVGAVLGAHNGAVEARRRKGQLDVGAVHLYGGACGTTGSMHVSKISMQ